MDEKTNPRTPGTETADSFARIAEFPSEPFQCPACGQLLAPSCRVCVACKHTINPDEIARPRQVAPSAAHASGTEPRPEPVLFPWRLFFVVLGIAFLIGIIFASLISWGLIKEEQAQLIMQGASTAVGVWVFFDALRRRVPRPLRWALGTMLLLAVIFPWYLARRNKLQSSVPFVEAEAGPVTRFLVFALLIFFLVSLIFYIVKGPRPATVPAPHPRGTRTVAIPQPGPSFFARGKRTDRRRMTA